MEAIAKTRNTFLPQMKNRWTQIKPEMEFAFICCGKNLYAMD
jgi:hypothetical protein